MLVLTRKTGESIVIDNKIRITIRKIQGKRVSLIIDAPKDVSVKREELVEKA